MSWFTMGIGTPPPTPDADKIVLYPKSDGWYYKDSTGLEQKIGDNAAVYVYGTRSAPLLISSAITYGSTIEQIQFIAGLGGPVIATIPDGSAIGQKAFFIGRSNINTVTFQNTGNLELNGDCVLRAKSMIMLVWDGTKHVEGFRNDI